MFQSLFCWKRLIGDRDEALDAALGDGFNPCSVGSGSSAGTRMSRRWVAIGFQSLFCWKRLIGLGSVYRGFAVRLVSILVLLEAAHRRAAGSRSLVT